MAVYHQAIRLHISLHRLDRAKAERQNNLRFYRHFQQFYAMLQKFKGTYRGKRQSAQILIHIFPVFDSFPPFPLRACFPVRPPGSFSRAAST